MKMKQFAKKGFTLIELMIVVVILGVLMSTVLPRLTGAQARARDTGRVADLGNIAAALQTYYDDYGEFPAIETAATGAARNGGECLGAAAAPADGAALGIKGYLKSSKVPLDPSQKSNGYLCPTAVGTRTGFYWYKPLTRSGVGNNSYVLCADTETFQKANTVETSATANPGFATKFDSAGTTYEAVAPQVGPSGQQLTADATNANTSLYCVTN